MPASGAIDAGLDVPMYARDRLGRTTGHLWVKHDEKTERAVFEPCRRTTALACRRRPQRAVHLVEEPPVQISAVAPDVFLVDFGRAAFGNLQVTPPANAAGKSITVHFGEAFKAGRIDRKPPGSVAMPRSR